MACDANSLMATAMASGYGGMSDRDLKMATLASACAGGGGGGGGNAVTVANTSPVGNGTTKGDMWINETNNNTWYWDSAAWIQLIGP